MTYSQPANQVALQLLQPFPLDLSPTIAGTELLQPPPECPPVTTQFLNDLREFLHAQSTLEEYRSSNTDFTRKPCFTFPALVVTILKEHAMAIQTRLDLLFIDGAFGSREKCPTASAFCQARVKVQPTFFHAWAEHAVSFFYDYFPQENLVATWHSRHLWAVDTTKINLPNNPETQVLFSVKTNQYAGTVQGQASFAFDVLNEVPVDAALGAIQAEKLFLVDNHAPHLNPNVVAIYDRGYEDFSVAAATVAAGADFIIRCRLTHGFKIVQQFAESGATDEISLLRVSKGQKKLALERGWPLEMRVRLLKLQLINGDYEVLMTSLLDRATYPAADFQAVYDKRWGVETAFLRFKKQLEVECFSSAKVRNIEQEFHAAVFLQACEAILDRKQDLAVRAKAQEDGLKYEYHINKAGAYSSLSSHLVNLFLSENATLAAHVAAYEASVRLKKSVLRPNRHNLRIKPKDRCQLNHYMYRMKRRY